MTKDTAYHVGRHGEVAGGMTQVVNGYLAWDFKYFDTEVIASRDGSKGPRAIALAASAALRILRLHGREGSVIVVHLSERGSFIREGFLLLLAHARGFATVAHLHGSEFPAFAKAHPRLVGFVLRGADLVISLSDESSAVARRFVPADLVLLVPNAVLSGRDRPKERLVVFGGAVSRRKGVDVLVAAWAGLNRRRPDHGWRLALAGPVTDDDVVPEALESADFLGHVDHSELMELLARSSVAVLPSRDEAMPMFILEAMARSNSIVSTTVGGIPAVLAGGAGELVPPGDATALERALDRAIFDDEFRQASAHRARAAFDASYSAAAVFPQVERVWRSALDLRRSR